MTTPKSLIDICRKADGAQMTVSQSCEPIPAAVKALAAEGWTLERLLRVGKAAKEAIVMLHEPRTGLMSRSDVALPVLLGKIEDALKGISR